LNKLRAKGGARKNDNGVSLPSMMAARRFFFARR
jgi:hypothetical protein